MIASLIFHVYAFGQGTSFDLEELCNQSDLIVVGKILSVSKVGDGSLELNSRAIGASLYRAVVRVDRTLKGDSRGSSESIHFAIPISPAGSMGYRGVSSQSYEVLFLRKAGDHTEFANPYRPSLIALPGSHKSHASDPLSGVLFEIGADLSSTKIAEQEKVSLIFLLGYTNSKLVTNILVPILNESTPSIEAASVAALLQQGYSPAMANAQKLLMSVPSPLPNYLIQNLASAVARYVKDANSISYLSVLLKSPKPEIRRAATLALRNTGSQKALPSLALALDDNDSEVRYYAVIGFGEVVNRPNWRPLREEFTKDEAKYTKYWRSWADANLPTAGDTHERAGGPDER